MKSTKMFFGNQYVGKFKCTGKKETFIGKSIRTTKNLLTLSAKICAVAWFVMGGLQIGLHYAPTNVVYADKEIIKEVQAASPVMERIAQCESGKNQIDPKTGQVLMRYNPKSNSMDIGYYQINETYNGKLATKKGYDLTNKEDNIAFAYELYKERGTEPWSASKSCWNK